MAARIFDGSIQETWIEEETQTPDRQQRTGAARAVIVFEIGDRVRLVRIPAEVLEPPEAPEDVTTRAIFEYCHGHIYRIVDILDDLDGNPAYTLEIKRDVEPVFGNQLDDYCVGGEDIEPVGPDCSP